MGVNGEKKIRVSAEQIFDVICLAASYGILFLLPEKIRFSFYLILGISAFLFCIGFFRLGISFDAPGRQRRFSALLRIAAVLVVLFGIAFAALRHFSESFLIIGVMLLIESVCLWKMGGGSNSFNSLTPEVQLVPGMKIPIEELHSVFADVKTQLGYPWVGKVKTIEQDSIIFGPAEDGFAVYGYYLYGQFYVAGSTNLLFPDAEDSQRHLVKEIPDRDGILLAKEDLPQAYAEMFKRYAESGDTRWSIETDSSF